MSKLTLYWCGCDRWSSRQCSLHNSPEATEPSLQNPEKSEYLLGYQETVECTTKCGLWNTVWTWTSILYAYNWTSLKSIRITNMYRNYNLWNQDTPINTLLFVVRILSLRGYSMEWYIAKHIVKKKNHTNQNRKRNLALHDCVYTLTLLMFLTNSFLRTGRELNRFFRETVVPACTKREVRAYTLHKWRGREGGELHLEFDNHRSKTRLAIIAIRSES